MAELTTDLPTFVVAGLPLCIRGALGDSREFPLQYIVTTPNMDWIPDLTLEPLFVHLHRDVHFYLHDYTLWPQWFFPGTYYMPYVRRRPDNNDLATHPYRLAWYDLTPDDFVNEAGCLTEVGTLRETLAQEFGKMERDLSVKIVELVALSHYERKEYRELQYARRGMHTAAVILSFAPQTYLMTLQTVTYFQRYFLEALACYEYFTIWKARWSDTGDGVYEVDRSVMGLVTPSLDVAQNYFQIGVPVWLVRPPSEIPSGMKVGCQTWAIGPDIRVVKEIYPGTAPIFSGPPSAERNRACQALRHVHLDLGHAAQFRQPGDPSQSSGSTGARTHDYILDRSLTSYSGWVHAIQYSRFENSPEKDTGCECREIQRASFAGHAGGAVFMGVCTSRCAPERGSPG